MQRLPARARKFIVSVALLAFPFATVESQTSRPEVEALIERAKSFELKTPYVPPPGDPLSHHASGFAKIMCSAVFITGLDPEFAAESVGDFIAPYAERSKFRKPVIDPTSKTVHITLPNGVTRTAKHFGSQGCITLPEGKTALNFTPVAVKSRLPDPSTQDWPMGDRVSNTALPAGVDLKRSARRFGQPLSRRAP